MARLDQYRQEIAYRIYVTDAIWGMAGENAPRYADMLYPRPEPEPDNRTVDETVDDIWDGIMGVRVRGN